MKKRVFIKKTGYVDVDANTEQEAIAAAAAMSEQDFTWKPLGKDDVVATAEVLDFDAMTMSDND